MTKNDLIVNGTFKTFLETKKKFYEIGLDTNEKENYTDYFDNETIDLCFKIYNSNKQRKRRNLDQIIRWYFLILRVRSYEKYKLIFLTLTFTDKVLEKTSEVTRRRYTQRFLNENTFHYIANIDYGAKNGREHYHALVMVDKDIDNKKWKYGAINFQRVGLNSKDIKSIKNYILKLNNHSYKESTKQKRIICDRTEDAWLDKGIDIFWSEQYKKFKLAFLDTNNTI